jgi:hypothetical protein
MRLVSWWYTSASCSLNDCRHAAAAEASMCPSLKMPMRYKVGGGLLQSPAHLPNSALTSAKPVPQPSNIRTRPPLLFLLLLPWTALLYFFPGANTPLLSRWDALSRTAQLALFVLQHLDGVLHLVLALGARLRQLGALHIHLHTSQQWQQQLGLQPWHLLDKEANQPSSQTALRSLGGQPNSQRGGMYQGQLCCGDTATKHAAGVYPPSSQAC